MKKSWANKAWILEETNLEYRDVICPQNITQLQCFEDCLCCSGPIDIIPVPKCL